MLSNADHRTSSQNNCAGDRPRKGSYESYNNFMQKLSSTLRIENLVQSDYICYINYQKNVNRSSTPHSPLNRLRLPWNCSLLCISILCHQAASSNESSREHTAAFSSINYFSSFLFFLSWSLHFLVSPFKRALPPEDQG